MSADNLMPMQCRNMFTLFKISQKHQIIPASSPNKNHDFYQV